MLCQIGPDPETFARDICRLLGQPNALVSLWNGLTTIAVVYKERDGTLRVIESVNYAGDPVRVQVQVKGSLPPFITSRPNMGVASLSRR